MLNIILIVYALVVNPVTPVRSEPDYGAEQETQLLLGETCVITEEGDGWCRVRNDYDGQTGWVENQRLQRLTEEEYKQYTAIDRSAFVCIPIALARCEETGETMPLTIGTHLPAYRQGRFTFAGRHYKIRKSAVATKPYVLNSKTLERLTRPLMNAPYLWGGKNCMGYDCSGFSNVVLSLFGKQLLRNAREQVTQGREVKSLSEAQAGDLVFFNHKSASPSDTAITHVGILLSQDRVIHCAGCVHADSITPQGIGDAETGNLRWELAAIRRY